jgi:choline dehydrogenase
VLAARLSEEERRSVLLLEAGPDYPDLNSLPEAYKTKLGWTVRNDQARQWMYEGRLFEGSPRKARVIRGRMIGGSGAINGAGFTRGAPEDYDAWGSALWTYEQVLPFFRKSEADPDFPNEYHGTAGPIPVTRFKQETWSPTAWAFFKSVRGLGFPEFPDLNAPDGTGIGLMPFNLKDGVRISAAIGYLTPAVRRRVNLVIKGNAVATRVLFDGTRATGVEYHDASGTARIEASEVVLSASGINSPHLLQLSGVGSADDLRRLGIPVVHNLPGVGKNLQDHVVVEPYFTTKTDSHELQRPPCVFGFTSAGSSDRNDMRIQGPRPPVRPGSDPLPGWTLSCSQQLMRSRGEVKVVSADPSTPPVVLYHYFDEPEDLRRMRESVRIAIEIMRQPAFEELTETIIPDPATARLDPSLGHWIRENVNSAHHGSGTCKMGPDSDSMAVVDDHCRVHGFENLRVVDVSISPTISRAPVNATAFMIGERAAALM